MSIAIGDRRFRLHVPVGYRSGSPAALVMALHGWGGTSQSIASNLRLYPLSDTHDFLLVLPDGASDPDGLQFWNATDACCDAYGSKVEDSAYLSNVIDKVDAVYDVDPARVFVIGISNGDFMAHRFACDHADQVSAFVSIAGAPNADPSQCHPSRSVSVLEVHGTADRKVRFEGGSSLRHRYPSVDRTVQTWRALDRCSGARHDQTPIDADSSMSGAETTRAWWGPCSGAVAVGMWVAQGSGHAFAFTHGFTASLLGWLNSHPRMAG
ncbi:alpha/beta hydrolase family esterase [Pedococcus sp. NPDC057267]|uniref:alpha/beta hydrolase family esterase n=1 Tax=Pedococcus sp. NPDC057267 TaxID=3346077 RepID=UPI00363724AB